MKAKPLPTQEYLRRRLKYNRRTGVLTWRKLQRIDQPDDRLRNSWNARFRGKIAGSHVPAGYLNVYVDNVSYPAQRLIWVMLHGYIEEGHIIDHRNGVRDQNNKKNLRSIPKPMNAKNQKLHAVNKSGVSGVHQLDSGNWFAQGFVQDGNKRKGVTLGTFPTLAKAAAARRNWERESGYLKEHGRRT